MALKFPKLNRKFPHLLFSFTGSLLLLQPLGAVLAAEQFDCSASVDGGWACDTKQPSRPLPPRPHHIAPAPVAGLADGQGSEGMPGAEPLAGEAAGTAEAEAQDYSRLDWVPRDKLTPAQLAEAGPYCSGEFIEPERPGMNDNTPAKEAPTYLSAKVSRYQQDEQISTLAGDVVMRQAGLQAEADEANLYKLENRGELKGHVRIRDKGNLVLGDKAQLQLDSGEAQVDDAEYVMHESHAHGKAARVKRDVTSIVHLKDGTYTQCAPDDNAWLLSGNNITLNPTTGRGSATNVVLRAKNIPILYTPYFFFPLDKRRQSGLLPPRFSTASDTGFSLMLPYYFNLAPNYDATLYPNYMAKHGLLTEGEFRFLTDNSEGQVGGSFLSDNENRRRRQSGFDKERWMFNVQDRTGMNSRLLGEVDYTSISDPYYFQDLDTQLNLKNKNGFLNQRGTLIWRGDSYQALLNAHAFERADVVDVTPYDMLPQLRIDGSLPFDSFLTNGFSYSAEAVHFQRDLHNGLYTDRNGYLEPWWDNMLKGLSRADGNRFSLRPTYSRTFANSFAYLKPTVSYMQTNYDLDLDHRGRSSLGETGETFDSSVSRGVGSFSLDGGLFFDRATSLFGQSARQTLEPRFFYLYVPKKNQDKIPVFDTSEPDFSFASLFRENRFAGSDRIGDANQLSLALTSRWINDDGTERQRISFGQIRYFQDRQIQMPLINYHDRASATSDASPYAMEYLYRFNHDWDLAADFAWDQDSHHTTSSGAALHYQPESDPRKIVNVGYRYSGESTHFDPASGRWTYKSDFGTPGSPSYIKDYYKINQHDLSATWPVLPQWNAIARWQFDYGRSRTLEAFGGFEYESCCWKVRLINRYWIDYDEVSLNPNRNDNPDRGVFLQIVLKGLGSVFGGKNESFLDPGIQGFRQREEQDKAY